MYNQFCLRVDVLIVVYWKFLQPVSATRSKSRTRSKVSKDAMSINSSAGMVLLLTAQYEGRYTYVFAGIVCRDCHADVELDLSC